jgi:hypothetical protein
VTVIRRLESAVVGWSDVCKGWNHKEERGENGGKFLLDVCGHGSAGNFCIPPKVFWLRLGGGGVFKIFLI